MKKSKVEMKQEVKKLFELAKNEKSLRLAIERMHEYNISTDGLEDNEYYVPRQVLKQCTETPGMLTLLKNPPKKEKKETDIEDKENFEKVWETLDSEERRLISLHYLESLYRRGKLATDKGAGYRVFKIVDPTEKVCTLLKSDTVETEDEVTSELARTFVEEHKMTVSPALLSSIYSYWKKYGEKIGSTIDDTGCTDGVLTCNSVILDEFRWSMFKSKHGPDASIPFPKLKATIDRMSEGKAFSAWIWGVYTGIYKGRQVFWIYGPDGEEGKSYLAKFLGKELFGENYGYKTIDGTQIKNGSRFLNSYFNGSKFIVYPDCNRVHLMEIEIIKTLSSGGRDSSVAEEKFKSAQTVTIDARVLVCSNFLPAVRRDNWYQSRLALCKISKLTDPKDPEIDKKYLEELPGFLAYAKACYEELCKDNEYIELTIESKVWLDKLVDLQEPLKKDIFERYFALDPNASITLKKIIDILEIQEKVTDKKSKEDWIEYLDTNLPGVIRERRATGNVYKGMKEKPDKAEVVPISNATGWKPFGKA